MAVGFISCIESLVTSSDIIEEKVHNTAGPLEVLKVLRFDCNEVRRSLLSKFNRNSESFVWDFYDEEVDLQEFEETLKSLTQVKHISIYGMKLSKGENRNAARIISLPNLQSLSSYDNDPAVHRAILKISSESLKRFTFFTKAPVDTLNFSWFLRRNKNLRKVSLHGSSSKWLGIRRLPQLSSLYIENCLDRDKTFSAICKLHNLSFLDVNITNMTSTAIKSLKHLTCLRILVLRSDDSNNDRFSDIAAVHIPNLHTLQLKLGNVTVTDDTLTKLAANNPQLTNLEMSFSENRNISDFVESCKQLESLTLTFTLNESSSDDSITNYFAGMYSLVENSKLKSLNLNFFNFGAQNIVENNFALLQILVALPRLESLCIHGIVFSFDEEFLVNILNIWSRHLEDLDLDFVSSDCKDFSSEFKCLATIADLLEEFNFSLSFQLQCLTHYEKAKANFCETDLSSDVEVTVTRDDPDYFKIELQKV